MHVSTRITADANCSFVLAMTIKSYGYDDNISKSYPIRPELCETYNAVSPQVWVTLYRSTCCNMHGVPPCSSPMIEI